MKLEKLPKVAIGAGQLHVSRLGLGTVKFGRTQGLRYPGPLRLPTDSELLNLLAIAKEAGLNLLDTAPSYGVAEERIGKLLSKGERQNWVIMGKAGEVFTDGCASHDLSPCHILKSLEQSLKQLRTDFLDIFLIHFTSATSDVLTEDLIGLLEDVKARGLARMVGASTHTEAGAIRAIKETELISHSMNSSTDPSKVLKMARETGTPVFGKKGLDCGYAKNPSKRIKHLLNTEGLTSLLIGTTNPQHLVSNIVAASLPENELPMDPAITYSL